MKLSSPVAKLSPIMGALCLAALGGCSAMEPERRIASSIPSTTNAPDPSEVKADPLPLWQTLLVAPWALAYESLGSSSGYSFPAGKR